MYGILKARIYRISNKCAHKNFAYIHMYITTAKGKLGNW